jgi:uncharacterized protein (TIRG00374 family)
MKSKIPFIIRLSIGLILITILLLSVDISQSIKQLSSVNMFAVFLLSGLMVIRRAMMAYKWNLLLRAQGIWISIYHSLRLYYIGSLIGSFTPGWIGLEAYRVNALSRFHRAQAVISTIVLERFIGLIVIATFAAVGLPFSLNYVGLEVKDTRLVFWIIICGVAFSWFLLIISLYPPVVEGFVKRLSSRTNISLFSKLKKFYDAYTENRKNLSVLVAFTALTAVNAIIAVSCPYMAAKSLNINIPFGLLISTIPLLLILLRLPVTISGIGVQEGLYAFLFSIAGFSSADGITVSLLLRLVALLMWNLPACILFSFK